VPAAGYSGTPLAKKLGIKPGDTVALVGAPAGFEDDLDGLPDGSVWVAWPKRSSGRATDLDENRLRDIGLPHGLVDNKVCAVDDVWSGLRFVWRKENRQQPP
jgi:hypothetical protein